MRTDVPALVMMTYPGALKNFVISEKKCIYIQIIIIIIIKINKFRFTATAEVTSTLETFFNI